MTSANRLADHRYHLVAIFYRMEMEVMMAQRFLEYLLHIISRDRGKHYKRVQNISFKSKFVSHMTDCFYDFTQRIYQ